MGEPRPPEPAFLADAMLGRLARWLAMLGYDSSFAGAGRKTDFDIAWRAREEGRVLLTRDTRIPVFAGLRTVVIRGQRFEDQLRQVFAEMGLKAAPERLFSRCTLCNLPVRAVPREEAMPKVPEKVRALDTPFFTCPGCARMYWNGTHVDRVLEKLRGLGLL